MMPPRRPWPRLAGRAAHALIAAGVSAAVLTVLAAGYGPVPGLGRALDPGHGAWAWAAGGRPAGPQTISLPGLTRPVSAVFTSHGVPSVRAATDADAYLALGYLHARFRLTEMDAERRLGEGRISELAGPAGLASDRFELRLGLLRTARAEWAAMPRSSPAGRALLAYARGVNDYLAQARASGDWPSVFALAGVYPRPWTPVDSLVLQGVLTQQLDYTTSPLDYALLARSLGPARTMAWFPVLPAGPQSPYDPGPYRTAPLAALPLPRAPATAACTAPATGGHPAGCGGRTEPVGPGLARAAVALLRQTAALPTGSVHTYPDSNAWAANGPAVKGATSMLAGDPHLPQTVPPVWYQAALAAPGLAVTGVTVPGLPGILIGHNSHIAWSLTDVQNQATFFYTEHTGASHPGQYFWRGSWRRMTRARYTIPVRGHGPVRLTVDQTVHGPVMTRAGQTTAVDWLGSTPSPDVATLLAINSARDFRQFRAALANWRAPSQNFVYADDRGNIGAISAGDYPVIPGCQPWLPMPGTGSCDLAKVIGYRSLPQVYDPPGHVVATANQRPAGPSYPYYIGTSANFFDPGFRANRIYALLRGHTGLTAASFAAIQLDVTDSLAQRVVPRLLAALRGTRLSPAETAAARLLAGWHGSMAASSAAASVWWTFWGRYLAAVFGPWWAAAKVPVHADRGGLAISPQRSSLDEVLAEWTLHDRANRAFTPPGGSHRTAPQVMRAAFAGAVAHLAATLHGSAASWAWGRLHTRQFPAITRAAGLGYGPRASGADPWTVNAAGGGLVSHQGPSWRMIVAWTGRGTAAGRGVYPGGQSENPASPWYEDQMADWWDGRYLPMPPAGGYAAGPVRWSLRPRPAPAPAAAPAVSGHG
jgi:penicillin G amidase